MPLRLRRRFLLRRLLLRHRIGATPLGVPDLERAAGTATGAGEIAGNAASVEQHGSNTGWFESIGMSAGEIFVPAACLFPPEAPITANNPFFLLQRTKPTCRRPRERSAPIPPLDRIPPLERVPEPFHNGGSRRRLNGIGAVVIMASTLRPSRSEPFPSRGPHPVAIPKQVLLAVGHFVPGSECRASRSPSAGWGHR